MDAGAAVDYAATAPLARRARDHEKDGEDAYKRS
jgi:hypothetical protein